MINNIREKMADKQIIITTHNNLIVTKFDLKKIQWINENNSSLESLKQLKEKVSNYFIKLENNNLLQFILSSKTILVEGPTEYLMIGYIYKQIYGESIEKKGIDIISCNGLTYKNYIEVAKLLNNRVAILTDNDGNPNKIKEISISNNNSLNVKIFTDENTDLFTWEKCLFEKNKNKDDFKKLIQLDEKAEYKVNGKQLDPKELGYLLNHKVEFAFKIIDSNIDIETPDYVKEALEWIRK